jgi:predicted transcriptional regulator
VNVLAQSPYLLYIDFYMKKILIEIDDETAAQIERVAPGRTRQRSEFIRAAIRQALWEVEERATAEAYTAQPDVAGEIYRNAALWDQPAQPGPKTSKRTRR